MLPSLTTLDLLAQLGEGHPTSYERPIHRPLIWRSRPGWRKVFILNHLVRLDDVFHVSQEDCRSPRNVRFLYATVGHVAT